MIVYRRIIRIHRYLSCLIVWNRNPTVDFKVDSIILCAAFSGKRLSVEAGGLQIRIHKLAELLCDTRVKSKFHHRHLWQDLVPWKALSQWRTPDEMRSCLGWITPHSKSTQSNPLTMWCKNNTARNKYETQTKIRTLGTLFKFLFVDP